MGMDAETSDFWTNTERYINWLQASDKSLRQKTLSTILTEVKLLELVPKNENLGTIVALKSPNPGLDSDDEDEKGIIKTVSTINERGDKCTTG